MRIPYNTQPYGYFDYLSLRSVYFFHYYANFSISSLIFAHQCIGSFTVRNTASALNSILVWQMFINYIKQNFNTFWPMPVMVILFLFRFLKYTPESLTLSRKKISQNGSARYMFSCYKWCIICCSPPPRLFAHRKLNPMFVSSKVLLPADLWNVWLWSRHGRKNCSYNRSKWRFFIFCIAKNRTFEISPYYLHIRVRMYVIKSI